jgi:Xaa-Pro dipeptidase
LIYLVNNWLLMAEAQGMSMAAGRVGAVWYEGETRRERLADALRRNRIGVLLALTPENAAYLSGRTSVIATLWRLPGLVAVAVNDRGEMAVAAGDNEIDGYDGVVARFAHPLWIEHLDLRNTGMNLATRVEAARPEGALSRPAQFDAELMLDAVASGVGAIVIAGRRIQVGAELAMLPAWVAEGLHQRLSHLDWVEAGAVFDDLRAIKDADEIAHLRLAAELTETGIAGARDAVQPGLSAIGVSAAYQRAIWDRAASDDRFAALRQVEGLVSVGDGAAPVPVGPGQTVKLDMQVDVGGYHSDVGRTYALEPTTEQQAVYDALRDALAAVVAALGPGVPMRDVWAVGTERMRAAGFANYSRGHLGHSVGLAHNYEEPPFIAADEARPLAPGMVVSVELPYYLLGVGSFQMERMVHIGASGAEVLDRLPFELDPGRGSEDASQGERGSPSPRVILRNEGSRLSNACVRRRDSSLAGSE